MVVWNGIDQARGTVRVVVHPKIVVFVFGVPRVDRYGPEKKLLEALADVQTRYAGKQFVMRLLRRIGSERCVDPVSAYLTDKKLSHMARFALERLPVPRVTDVLLEALDRVEGDLKLGIISSLAGRGERRVVPRLTPFLKSGDTRLVEAAIRALARLGGGEAASALRAAKVEPELKQLKDDAVLACADSLLKEGKREEAVSIYRSFVKRRSKDPALRLAAYRGLFLADKENGVAVLLPLLKESNRILRNGARRFLIITPGIAVTKAVARELEKADPALQVQLIDILSLRGDRSASGEVAGLAERAEGEVKLAAVRALGALGGAGAVKLLCRLSAEEGELGKAAFDSLLRLRGDGVAEALSGVLAGGETKVKLKVVEALLKRREKGALSSLLEASEDVDSSVRKAAFKALGELGGRNEFEKLLHRFAASVEDRKEIFEALRALAARAEDKEAEAQAVLPVLENSDSQTRIALLGLLPVLGTKEALEAVRRETRNSDPAVARAAAAAMAAWPTAEPLNDLFEIARNSRDPEAKAWALRGYIELLSYPANRSLKDTVALFRKAFDLARRKEDRKELLLKLSKFPCREALEFVEKFVSDPQLGEAAKETAGKIKSILLNAKLSAVASHNSRDTKFAFDGNPATRWTTNTPMRPGMWFVLDLGVEHAIKKIVLDTRNSRGDYPRGSEVYVSFDGKSWGKPVLKSKAQGPITTYVFPKPIHGRFIKIVQTGRTQGLYWSIHELKVEVE